MVEISALSRLEMKCRGGYHCCIRNDVKLCGEGRINAQEVTEVDNVLDIMFKVKVTVTKTMIVKEVLSVVITIVEKK